MDEASHDTMVLDAVVRNTALLEGVRVSAYRKLMTLIGESNEGTYDQIVEACNIETKARPLS